MVVGAFPLVKLGGLLLRQISKPIANYVKEKAKHNTFFRTYICMPPAQLYNWCEIQTKMWILNLGKPVNIPVLSEAMAIELGSNLLGEGIVFCIAAGLLIAEYNRSANREKANEEARKEDLKELLLKIQELYFKVEQQETHIRELTRTVVSIDKAGFTSLFRKNAISDLPTETPQPPKDLLTKAEPGPIITEKLHYEKPTDDNMNFILKAAEVMQEEITGNNHDYRENGIVINAISYIQNDVYRQQISVK